jgi:hypothetical protein
LERREEEDEEEDDEEESKSNFFVDLDLLCKNFPVVKGDFI